MADIEHARSARKSVPAFHIIHDIAEDFPDGQPWPPDGDGFWAIVSRADGFTKWRRIILQMPSSISSPNDVDGGVP